MPAGSSPSSLKEADESLAEKLMGAAAAAAMVDPFVRAEVVELGEEAHRVRGPHGEAEVPARLLHLAEPPGTRVNNLQLLHLNEANLLENVRARFDERQIYTYTGQLELLAVNPYEDIAGMYAEDAMARFRRATPSAPQPPHSFAIAERIWRSLEEAAPHASAGKEGSGKRKEGKEGKEAAASAPTAPTAHSVVVSGESGAGKTETNKHLMAYLRWRAGGGEGGARRSERISPIISVSNTILEAVGNARTTNNNNSSRFGKYLTVTFDGAGLLCAAAFRTYLLEKSRVVRQATHERNFHAFYQAPAIRGRRHHHRITHSSHLFLPSASCARARATGCARACSCAPRRSTTTPSGRSRPAAATTATASWRSTRR